MSRRILLGIALGAVSPLVLSDDTLEEIIITAALTANESSITERPVHVITANELTKQGTQSIGEALDALAGVSSTDFGGAVGQPVIRGLTGNRVKVLQNSMVVRDVSALGPDHANDIDLHNVQQIEVVRGPSALLYANGTSGGIVNVVDNTIARSPISESSLEIGAEAQSVNDGSAFSAIWQGNVAGLNTSYAFKTFDANPYDVPMGAILHSEEEHHEEEHEEEHEMEHEEHEEHGMDMLANSDQKSESHRFGVSKTGDWGYVGASFQQLTSTYGVPFHSEAAHSYHEGEHGEEHDEGHEEGHEESHEAGHEEHGEERIFSSTESDVFTIEGSYNVGGGLLNSINYSLRNTDYMLTEQHAEEAHEEEEHEGEEHEGEHAGHSEEPTIFSNEATELSVIFDLGGDDSASRVVLNHVVEDISILGEEVFMQPVESTETTVGFFTGLELSNWHLDVGARWDSVERQGFAAEHHEEEEHEEEHEGDHEEEHESMPFTFDDDSLSLAGTLSTDLNDSTELALGLASVAKMPSSVELFMNGAHLASARFEVGDADLKTERSNNLDLSINYEGDDWYARAAIYRNSVDNYIYLRDELEEEHEEYDGEEEEGHEEEHHDDHGGLILAEFTQADAVFTGYELEVGRSFTVASGILDFRLQRDAVSAEFSSGGNVPRVVPARNVIALDYSANNGLGASLEVVDVESHSDVALGETTTQGFTLINASLSKSFMLDSESVLTITAFGRNLNDEVARNHSSFVKDAIPLPGRNIGIRATISF